MHLVWTEEEFGTGDPVVDAQHRELFLRANLLLDAVAGPHPEGEVRLTLQFLSSYVIPHFSAEERAMALVDSPMAARNSEEHRWFVGRLGEVQDRFREEGISEELAREISDLLLDWISTHVREIDTGMRGAR